MTKYDKNLTRALAIFTTEPDENDVSFNAGSIIVRGQRLNPQNDDDRAVLSILMSYKEFGFSVSTVENLAKELRELQQVWFDAADELKPDARFAEVAPKAELDVPMTDKRALEEVVSAVEILQRHLDHGFLLGIWQEQMDGILYRYADGCYESRAISDAEDAA